jgi:hypothetical protein
MRELPIANCRLPIVLAFVFIAHAVSGCGTSGKTAEKVGDVGIMRTAGEGPVTLTLTVRPAEPAFNERAEVVVVVIADKGVTVDVGDYERSDSLAEHQFEFRVTPVDRKSASPTEDGKLKWTYRYAVDFFLPGPYELPAAVVSFVDSREASDSATPAQAHELKTEPLTVVARDTKPLTPEELKTITALPPVELREPWSHWWWAVPPLLATLATLIAALVRRSLRRQQIVVPIPAHEWAKRQIAVLVSEDLVRRGRVQEFYYRISDIVRGYVERRFGVSAPEMTTEEFLVAAASERRFGERNTAELNEFLSACDLVKYARQLPGADEADAVLRAAGGFVERTRESLYRTDAEESRGAPTMERAA